MSDSLRLSCLIFSLSLCCAIGDARAEDVCIGKNNAQADIPRAVVVEGSRVLGTLEHRRCYPVMERLDGHTRIFVAGDDGYHGEVEVSNSVLAHVLTDDVEMRLEPDGEVFGRALSGALVFVSPHRDEELFRATLVEGRLRAQFLVEVDDFYPAQSWPLPDPEEFAGANWPEASMPLPPDGEGLLDEPQGMTVRAEITTRLGLLSDLHNDPGLGQWRMSVLQEEDGARKVRIVGPTAWADGWVLGRKWLADVPADGWAALDGFPATQTASGGVREVGKKPASLHLAVKGPVLGALQPGARVDVMASEKNWLKVRSRWDGGEVSGWLEKKRLVKEGKEGPLKVRVEKVSAVRLARSALQWMTPEDHREEVPVEEPVDASSAGVVDGEAAEEAEPEVQTRIPDPELNIDPALSRLRESMPRLQWLYAQALSKKPELRGETTVRLVVDLKGELEEKGIFSSNLDEQSIGELISADLEELSFEKRRAPRRKRGEAKKDWRIVVWVQYAFDPAAQ